MKKHIGAPIKKALCFITLCGAVVLSGCGQAKQPQEGGNIAQTQQTLAARFSERLDCDDYDVTIRSDDVVSRIVRSGNNGCVTMTSDGIESEFYNVNGSSYLLLPEIKCFRRLAGQGTFGNAFVKLGEKDMLFDITETDTEITEVYKPTYSNLKETYYFTFDKATGEIKRAVTKEDGAEEVVTEVLSMVWKADEIEMPDLTGWDDISDDADVSDATSMKFIFYRKGITPDMVEKAGYTFEQIAHMSTEESDALADKILAEQGNK